MQVKLKSAEELKKIFARENMFSYDRDEISRILGSECVELIYEPMGVKLVESVKTRIVQLGDEIYKLTQDCIAPTPNPNETDLGADYLPHNNC